MQFTKVVTLKSSISASLMPSSSLGSFDQVFVVSSMCVPSLMVACAAENNPDDSVDHGLCLYLVGKNGHNLRFFSFPGFLHGVVCWSEVLYFRSCQKLSKGR